MAAPEVQKADQCFSAAAKAAVGSPAVWPEGWKAQQKARRSLAGVRTKRCADSCFIAAAMPGQVMLTE